MRLRPVLIALVTALTAALAVPLTAGTAKAAEPDPVVFVHGFSGKGDQFDTMIANFRANGYPADRLHAFSYSSLRSNYTIAEDLAAFVADVRDRTGAAKVDLVSHSMGGLSTRHYLKELGGTAHVDDWVSIGGPNNGTRIAGFCDILITACEEMTIGSDFLKRLNSGDPTPGDVAYTTFRSPCDLVINPVSSTILDGADNRTTSCVGHIGMISNTGVINAVRGVVL